MRPIILGTLQSVAVMLAVTAFGLAYAYAFAPDHCDNTMDPYACERSE